MSNAIVEINRAYLARIRQDIASLETVLSILKVLHHGDSADNVEMLRTAAAMKIELERLLFLKERQYER